tara:strand:- start:845 stop:1066 length:222 start_codon:yes stop_codon:yes gene_type:complete
MSALDSLRHHPALTAASDDKKKERAIKGATNRTVQLAKSHLELAERRYNESPCEHTLAILNAAQEHLRKVRFG